MDGVMFAYVQPDVAIAYRMRLSDRPTNPQAPVAWKSGECVSWGMFGAPYGTWV